MNRLSAILNLSAAEATLLSAHRNNMGVFHDLIASAPITVDLKVAGNNALPLPGAGALNLIPVAALILCRTANALNADAQLSFGTTPGGREIMAPFPLAALNTALQSFAVSLTGLFVPVLDNAALDCTVENADTGTSGTIEVVFLGRAR